MNISYKWLKEYVDFDLTPQQVCDALTSTGLEVDALEEVQSIKGGLKGLYVGKVLTCEMHPDSDHLHVRSSWLIWAVYCMMVTRSLSSRSRSCVASSRWV